MISRKDRIGAAIILVTTFVIFRVSPLWTVYDSKFEMLFSQQLLWEHSFSLAARAFPELQSRKPGQLHQRGVDLPYQLVQVGERFYNFYPPGNIILGIPYVALANAMGISAMREDGTYDSRGDVRMQRGLAAVLMAGLSAITFLTSRLLLSLEWSCLITAATAFGTQIWSTASRAMWSHTWGIFILGFAVWLIVRAETKQAPLRPVLLATCLSWLYFVRPTFGLSIIAIALYVLVYHRAVLLPFALTGCIWLAALIGYSQYHFGELLPLYYHSYDRRLPALFMERLAGTLISPSRGLFIYVPILVFVGYLLVRYSSTLRLRLAILALGVVLCHIMLIAGFLGWHGGYCYGPRLSTDVVPWLALLGMLAVEARLRWRAQNKTRDSALRVRMEWSFAVLLLVCSIALNGVGAIWGQTQRWNMLARNENEYQRLLWDWKHPQFLGVPRNLAKAPHGSAR